MKNLPQMNRINADFNTFALDQGKKNTKVGVFKIKPSHMTLLSNLSLSSRKDAKSLRKALKLCVFAALREEKT